MSNYQNWRIVLVTFYLSYFVNQAILYKRVYTKYKDYIQYILHNIMCFIYYGIIWFFRIISGIFFSEYKYREKKAQSSYFFPSLPYFHHSESREFYFVLRNTEFQRGIAVIRQFYALKKVSFLSQLSSSGRSGRRNSGRLQRRK